MGKAEALQLLLMGHLLPLHERVIAQIKFTNKEVNFDTNYDELVAMLMKNVGLVL
jgi:hypothetical protein